MCKRYTVCEYAKHHNSNNSQHQKLLVPEDQKIQKTVESTLANIPSFLPKLKKLSNKKNKQEFMFFLTKNNLTLARQKRKQMLVLFSVNIGLQHKKIMKIIS